MRLQKYLAACGVGSRRKCEEYIQQGRVSVNGETVTVLGTKIKGGDIVCLDNKEVKSEERLVYYLLNKPVGYVTTVKDEKNRPTVLDLFQGIDERIFPIGRLDYNTSGLLLLTNDGELTYALTHPKHEVDKIYRVKIKGQIEEKTLDRLRKGVIISGRKTAPAIVQVITAGPQNTVLSMTIHEGRNRQIRKMCEAVGHSVMKLTRVAIGEMTLEDLQVGKYRKLTANEVRYLKKAGGLDV